MRILIILASIFYLNVNAAELEGCEAIKDQFSYNIVMSQDYIEKFKNYDAAEKHCWDSKFMTEEIDMFAIDCFAKKDADHGVKTNMSTRFISQYNSIEKAMKECWWLYGIQDSPADFKNLSRVTGGPVNGPGVFNSYDMHRDHVDTYFDNEEKQQKLREKIHSANANKKDLEKAAPDDVEICTQDTRPSVEIKVSDSQSYENLNCKANIVAINKDLDGYSQKLDNDNCLGYLQSLIELPGSYEIIIDVPGYAQQKLDIEIEQDECHVNTVNINLLLDRI